MRATIAVDSSAGSALETMMFWSRVFTPFALGYFISQLFRSVNAVVFADLVRELSLDAWTVGLLTSSYFLAFAVAQLPVGIALDRYGARRTESVLLLAAVLGALVFSLSDSSSGLSAGRALIGLGVSACLMASFHAFVAWGRPERLPFLNGAVMAIGAAGALTATVPMEWAITHVGWRGAFQALAAATLLFAAIIFVAVPDKAPERASSTLADVSKGLRDVFRERAFWSVLPLSVSHQAAFLSIQSLWAGPWLRDVSGLGRQEVAQHLMWLTLAMGVGFLFMGGVAARLARRGVTSLVVWASAAVVFQMTQLAVVLEWVSDPRLAWASFGFFGASGMLSYGILTSRFPRDMAGRVNSALNVFVFAGAFALQAGLGAMIARFPATVSGFAASGYRTAFGLALALQAMSLVWLALTSAWRRPTA